jgi:hypothetical protein
MNTEQLNFEACFKHTQEATSPILDKISLGSLPLQVFDDNIPVCVAIFDHLDYPDGIKTIYYNTKIGLISIGGGVFKDKEGIETFKWGVDFKFKLKNSFTSWLRSLPIEAEKALEFFIGNHIPESGNITPIKNIIHHTDGWLASKENTK